MTRRNRPGGRFRFFIVVSGALREFGGVAGVGRAAIDGAISERQRHVRKLHDASPIIRFREPLQPITARRTLCNASPSASSDSEPSAKRRA